MNFRILNFDKKEQRVQNENEGELFYSADYWQWYITGIESLINENDFVLSDRYDNERSEVLTYNFYENENISDVLLLVNNDNYLWDAPVDGDLLDEVIDNKFNYFKKINKTPLSTDEEMYWENKIKEKSVLMNNVQREIVIPIRSELQKVIRNINKFIQEREVQ